MIRDESIELGRELLHQIRQSPAVEVKVRGINMKNGRSLWFPRKYVVQDDLCHTALELGFLARLDEIAPTMYYGRKKTTKQIDPRLINYPEAIFDN